MIVAYTPNPALDHTLTIERLNPGSVHAGAHGNLAAGGKGINVARVLGILGAPAIAAGPIGGPSGDLIKALATRDGIRTAFTQIAGNSRTCTIVSDESSATVVNESGPEISAAEWDRAIADLGTLSLDARFLTISGSLPPACPTGTLQRLAAAIDLPDDHVWIDCSPAGLCGALGSGRSVKVNHHEASTFLSTRIPSPISEQWAVELAEELVSMGAHQAIVTLGNLGAVWASPERTSTAASPSVKALNAVGSGDSFLAGLVAAQAHGLNHEAQLRQAVAAGAANAVVQHVGDFTKAAVIRLAEQVTYGVAATH